MALTRISQFDSGTILTESALEGEFDNIYSNAISLISPLTANLAANGFSVTGLDELAFNNAGAAATATRRLRANGANLSWHDGTSARNVISSFQLRSYLAGLTMSNGTDATNDIDIAVGAAMDSTNVQMLTLASGITKQLDAAWAVGTNAGGLDTGAIANTTYHIYLIYRTDTAVVDAIFSASASAPTLPANYTLYRRIGSITRVGGTIVAFKQVGDRFQLVVGVADVSVANPGTSAVTATLSVPTGIVVDALLSITVLNVAATASYTFFSPLSITDQAASATHTHISLPAIANSVASVPVTVKTNTSAQFRYRTSYSDGNTSVTGTTEGWMDQRGRDA